MWGLWIVIFVVSVAVGARTAACKSASPRERR